MTIKKKASFVWPARTACLGTFTIVLLGAACGCGGPNASPSIKVSGVVTLEGAPVEGAKVTYNSSSGNAPAIGKTDSKGRFELATFDMKTLKSMDGALPGEYKVTVEIPSPGRSPLEQMEAEHMKGRAGGAQKANPVLHANYTDVSKTPLKQVVPSPGAVELKLTKSGT